MEGETEAWIDIDREEVVKGPAEYEDVDADARGYFGSFDKGTSYV